VEAAVISKGARAAVIVLAGVVTAFAAAPAGDVGAFSVSIHEGITFSGLGPPSRENFSFLRRAVFDDIADQHDQIDSGFSGARDERHFDDCEFDGGAKYIRDRYAEARGDLVDADPWDATDAFGNLLHPAQDVYAHSDWIELGFPRTPDNPATPAVDVARSDLVDLSGAQSSLAQPWRAPAGGGIVRSGILLGADDWNIPLGWSIVPDGGGRHVPTLVDPEGRARGRLLVTGEGRFDDECDVHFSGIPLLRAYNGFEHSELNKDAPDGPNGPSAHTKAAALATLQTGYEWCRLVRDAGRSGRDGLLLATWVRAGGNPHPAGTPCAPGRPGPRPVVVSVESLRVLDSGDNDDNDPGEIQVAAALYDDPQNFHRSAHATNRGGRVALDDGQRMPADRLPPRLRLCVPSGTGATFAMYGWDNDDDSGDLFANDFDDKGDDDELLVGFQRRFGTRLPRGLQVARSDDLEIRYRVTRTSGPAGSCPPELTPPSPSR
jgi:hypothetical protein